LKQFVRLADGNAAGRQYARAIRRPVMVNDNDLMSERRSESGIFSPVDAEVRANSKTLANGRPPILKHRTVNSHSLPHNRHEPPARLEPQ
jgi:hypothetical protein